MTYTPNKNFFGTDTFTYMMTDTHGDLSNVATVAITVNFVNQLPIAENDIAVTQPGVPVTINVLSNDFDRDGNVVPSTLTIVQPPLNGTAQVVGGQILYTPQAGYVGGDSLQYTVNDNDGGVSNVASVAIRVGDPVAVSGYAFVDANGDGVKQPSEYGIPGVTVELSKTDGNYTFTTFALTALTVVPLCRKLRLRAAGRRLQCPGDPTGVFRTGAATMGLPPPSVPTAMASSTTSR